MVFLHMWLTQKDAMHIIQTLLCKLTSPQYASWCDHSEHQLDWMVCCTLHLCSFSPVQCVWMFQKCSMTERLATFWTLTWLFSSVLLNVSPQNISTTKCFVALCTFYCICFPSANLPTPVHCWFSLINTYLYCRELRSVSYQYPPLPTLHRRPAVYMQVKIFPFSDNMLLYFKAIVNITCPNPNHGRYFGREKEENVNRFSHFIVDTFTRRVGCSVGCTGSAGEEASILQVNRPGGLCLPWISFFNWIPSKKKWLFCLTPAVELFALACASPARWPGT